MTQRYGKTGAACILTLLITLGGCTTGNWNDAPSSSSAPISEQAASVDLPRSKRGNPPFYEVYGVRYTVMQSSAGYREKGVASWYGKKFHGRDTSSGERYNMYAMTAAHKTLPLPTNVRVTNLETGKSIILRVNDRGPFVNGRLIDLSYVAAQELGVIANGTARVEVVALNGSSSRARQYSDSADEMYLQVGAFGEPGNAQKLADQLTSNGITKVLVHESRGETPKLFRVRVGPLNNIAEYDRLSQQVERLQMAKTHLVVESDS
ncbi:MAG: septal ring lytic transglycosylase RlpA family protein [Gammaproteobacteria bacterium]|nr:MAG: septal ring lytic transglycosylase RlpA family protein [Gammaproteobacteria bacterium]